MKLFLMALLSTSLLASAAFAGSISLDTRFDFQNVDFNDAGVTGANADNSRLYFRVGRLDYQGKLSEDVTFRLRYAFTSFGANNVRDNAADAVQFAAITQKLFNGLSLTLGKFNPEMGGYEGITSGSDMYLQSEYFTHKFGNNSLGSSTYGVGDKHLYMTGLRLDYAFMDQTLTGMILDPIPDQAVGATGNASNQKMWGFLYKGSFMDKTLGVMASYHLTPGAGNAFSGDDKTSFSTVGLKWTSSPVLVSLDYNMESADFTPVAGTSRTDKMTTIIAKVAYTGFEQWTPRLEYHTTKEDFSTNSNTFTGMGAVAEYKPIKENNFRYHVAYNSITATGSSYAQDQTRTEILVGTRMLADFLK